MPMKGTPVVDPATGRVIGIACSRGGRYAQCSACGSSQAKLACDGCDKPLCAQCSVAPTSKLDFCPDCTKPAFDWWKENAGGASVYAGLGRNVGRMQFRAWVSANKKQFFELAKPRTEASKAEVKR